MDNSSAQRRPSRNEDPNVASSSASPIMSRRTSHESDRATNTSTVSGLTNHFPTNTIHVNPAPAYVGHAGASQALSELHLLNNRSSSDADHRDEPHDLRFSDPALALINAFLDQLLYSFLSSARSTSLPALRPAIADVLKHRLAREAMSNADAELSELLGGTEDEEEMDNEHKAQELKRKWDLELIWKRTRLRVMVYTRLGEMEDEDEQRYVEREELFHGSERSFSTSGLVAWSAAIFLTSVLEYVAEQALQVAGQAACNRVRRESRDPNPSADQGEGAVTVEEHDVEKIALNSSLGRLWRTWRKALRNQGVSVRPSSASISRASRENMASRMSHHTDAATSDSRPISREQQHDFPEADYSESVLAANIPLPLLHAGRDIDEITAVGLARDPDDNDAEDDDPNTPYPEHVLAPLVPLPLYSEQRDLDEIFVPGLARDPDEEAHSISSLDEVYPALTLALLVALPMLDLKRDVDEIEVPGLAKDPDAADESTSFQTRTQRRRSFAGRADIGTASDEPHAASVSLSIPPRSEQRSTSVPPPTRLPMAAKEGRLAESPIGFPSTLRNPVAASTAEESKASEGSLNQVSGQTVGSQNATATNAQLDGAHDEASKVDTPLVAAGAAVIAGTVAVAGATLTSAKADVHSPQDDIVQADDQRKSLGDMKSLLSDSRSNSERVVHQTPQGSELQSPGIMDIESDDSYNLVDADRSNATSSETSLSKVGVAQTTESPVMRQPGKRPDGLDLNQPRKDQQERSVSPITPRTPRTFLDLTEDNNEDEDDGEDIPQAYEKQPSPLPVLRNSIDSVSRADKSLPPKRSVSFESPPPNPGKSSLDSVGVQEHPVVQRMASLKSSDAHSSSGSETALPITSAAIRGPEDFDLFVQGGETLKYTLTPEGVRDVPANSNTVRYSKARSSPIESDGAASSPRVERFSADGRTGAVRSSVLRNTTASPTTQNRPSDSDYRSLTRPSPRNAGAASRNGLLAREPRVQTESTRDIADFIRSTGPNAPSTMMTSTSPRAKSNLQPRTAKAESDGSADLIDFIRSGPSEAGQHRIPRSVAPFRTTMDSDRFDTFSDRQSADTPTQSVLSSYPSSFRTSTNSRSALLNGNSTSVNQTAPLSPHEASFARGTGILPDPEPSSARKQYRNKDPYALDFDDEFGDDDDDLFNSIKPANAKQESMFDFLRNHKPAPTGPPQPLIDPNSPQARRLISEARARERGGSNTASPAARTTNVADPPRAPTPQFAGTYQPTRPKMEARSPVTQGAGVAPSTTKDLANFIRNSGPAGDAVPAPTTGPKASAVYHQETKKKKGGIFGLPKRKTYLDMP